MNRNTIIFFVFLLSNILSCSFLVPTPKILNDDIDNWLKHNRFNKIYNAISYINKQDPAYKYILNRLPEIEKNKQTYIRKKLKQAQKLKENNEWNESLNTYNTALANTPDSKQLKQAREQIIELIGNELKETRKRLLLKQANALISYTPIYEKLHKLIPNDNSAKLDIDLYEKEKLRIALQLEKCGQQSIEDKNYHLAKDCYSLSNSLSPSKQKLSKVKNLDGTLKENNNIKRYKNLLHSYKRSYKNKQYNEAKMYLNTLLAIDPEHTIANTKLIALNKEIAKKTTKKINLGKEYYSKKNIKKSLIEWKQALKLSPSNSEIIQLINRAEKVQKNLDTLEALK